MRKIQILTLILPALLLLSACSSTGLSPGNGTINNGGGGTGEMADKGQEREPVIPPRPCCINPDHLRKEHDDPASILFKRSVYFDFDQYTIKDEFKPLVEAHGKYLSKHREIKVYVIGNTDAVGSREYNLALGQKRAESLHTVFSLLGVAENQLEVISYGAEQPKAQGDDEAAHAENRRVDIIYPTQ